MLLFFFVAGGGGGLGGWNRRHVRSPFARLMEVLGVTFLMTAVIFLIPMLWGSCTPKPVDMEDWTQQVLLSRSVVVVGATVLLDSPADHKRSVSVSHDAINFLWFPLYDI